MLLLVVQSGHEGHCRSHQLRSHSCQQNLSHQERHHLLSIPRPPVKTAAILLSERDWQILVDLEQQLKFPGHIAMITLTFSCCLSPQKDGPAGSHSLLGRPCGRALWKKTSDALVSNCQKGGWRARCFPIKVRCCISSLSRAPCIVGVDKQRIICNITEAEAVSWWLKRGEPWGL